MEIIDDFSKEKTAQSAVFSLLKLIFLYTSTKSNQGGKMLKRLKSASRRNPARRADRVRFLYQKRLEILNKLISIFITKWELSLVDKSDLARVLVDQDYAPILDMYRTYLEKQTLGKLRELARGL